METNELRRGNQVYYGNDQYARIVTVNEIYDHNIQAIDTTDTYFDHASNFNPIPLTEKKLLELGFEKNEPVNPETHGWADYTKDNLTISIPYFEFVYDYGDGIVELKSIHHLQNLYHALKGKELNLEK